MVTITTQGVAPGDVKKLEADPKIGPTDVLKTELVQEGIAKIPAPPPGRRDGGEGHDYLSEAWSTDEQGRRLTPDGRPIHYGKIGALSRVKLENGQTIDDVIGGVLNNGNQSRKISDEDGKTIAYRVLQHGETVNSFVWPRGKSGVEISGPLAHTVGEPVTGSEDEDDQQDEADAAALANGSGTGTTDNSDTAKAKDEAAAKKTGAEAAVKVGTQAAADAAKQLGDKK